MSESDALQFDRAEFDSTAAQTQCAECQRPLAGSYFDVNGQTVCEACRYAIEARATAGSGAGRFVRAAGAGLVAAILGALLYYGIFAVSGYEFGLIAIVVGFGVGAAVRWGSNGRGGWVYQGLAMLLTYLAIVSTYIPPILEAIRSAPTADAAITASATPTTTPDTTPASTAAPVTAAAETAAQEPFAPAGPASIVVAFLLLLAFACALPFLAGFQNIIGLIIIGVGLYEAWKLNRRTQLTITGPHALARPPAATSAV